MTKLTLGMKIKSNKTNNTYIINSIDKDSNRLTVNCIEDQKLNSEWLLDLTIDYINNGKYEIVKEERKSNDLTNLEIQVLEDIKEQDGNGEYILESDGYSQYISILHMTLKNKTLRGVLSSLVKKEYIKVYDNGEGSILELKDKAIEYYNS